MKTRASLMENGPGENGQPFDYRAQQELLAREIKHWDTDSAMNSLMPVQNYF